MTTRNPIPSTWKVRNDLWARAASLVGLKRADWIRQTLDARAIDIVSAVYRAPMLLKPGTPIWARDEKGQWRLRQMSLGREEVIITTKVEGLPPYIDASCEGWLVTWVAHGTNFVVPYASICWPPGRRIEGLSSTNWLEWLMGEPARGSSAQEVPCAPTPASPVCPSPSSSACSSPPSSSPPVPASPTSPPDRLPPPPPDGSPPPSPTAIP